MIRGIARHARTLPHILTALGLSVLPLAEGFWIAQVLPAVRSEMERRSRPKPLPGSGPIAPLKALDIVEEASRFTELTGSGDRLKGKCPLHEERTPSFYVYADTQRWHCYGACASGGDLVDLLARLDGIGRLG